MDLANMRAKHVGVYTDKNLAELGPMKATVESLTKAGINFKVKQIIVYLQWCSIESLQQVFLKTLLLF